MSTYKVDNIRLVDTLIDDTDPTKKLKLSLANITTDTTRTLIVPNANTTIVGTDVFQVLTNKTITDPSNIVSASNLRTTTTDIIISGADAPTSGQVLTATSPTSANWQTPNILATGGALIDSQTVIVDDVDVTKRIKFENSGATTNTTLTLALSQTFDRTITIPDISDTLVTRTNTETLTNKTLISPSISTITNSGTLTLPTGTDTIVARDTTDILINKNITGTTNNVSANNLKTTGSSVVISGAAPPTTGQILTATSPTTATWQNNSSGYTITLYNNGAVTTPNISTQKQWYGRAVSAGGIATFQVTTNGLSTGTAIFTNLAVNTHYMQSTSQLDTTSSTAAPFASIRRVTNSGRSVEVNVKTGNFGSILLGGNYTGLRNAQDGCNVYLYIIGV